MAVLFKPLAWLALSLLTSCARLTPTLHFDCEGQPLSLDYHGSRAGLSVQYQGESWLLAPLAVHGQESYVDEYSHLTVAADGQSLFWQFKQQPVIRCPIKP